MRVTERLRETKIYKLIKKDKGKAFTERETEREQKR